MQGNTLWNPQSRKWPWSWYAIFDQQERESDGAVHWKSMVQKLRYAFQKEGWHAFLILIGSIIFGSIEETHAEQPTTQSRTRCRRSEDRIPIDNGKWIDLIANEYSHKYQFGNLSWDWYAMWILQERESDGAVHWKSKGPKLRYAFLKDGRDTLCDGKQKNTISMLQELLQRSIVHSRHSRADVIAPELMGHVAIPFWNGKNYCIMWLFHREPHPRSRTPRRSTARANKHSLRTPSAGSILAKAPEKRLKFWQTSSRAIVVHASVSADCLEKVVSESAWNFIAAATAAAALRTGYQTESIMADLGKKRKIQQVQRGIESYNSKIGEMLNCMTWEKLQKKNAVSSMLKVLAWGITLLPMWCLPKTQLEKMTVPFFTMREDDTRGAHCAPMARRWQNRASQTARGWTEEYLDYLAPFDISYVATWKVRSRYENMLVLNLNDGIHPRKMLNR